MNSLQTIKKVRDAFEELRKHLADCLEQQGGCDHSVGICSCGDRNLVEAANALQPALDHISGLAARVETRRASNPMAAPSLPYASREAAFNRLASAVEAYWKGGSCPQEANAHRTEMIEAARAITAMGKTWITVPLIKQEPFNAFPVVTSKGLEMAFVDINLISVPDQKELKKWQVRPLNGWPGGVDPYPGLHEDDVTIRILYSTRYELSGRQVAGPRLNFGDTFDLMVTPGVTINMVVFRTSGDRFGARGEWREDQGKNNPK